MSAELHPTVRIARVVYEAVRAFALEAEQDKGRKPWDEAPELVRDFYVRFVAGTLADQRLNAYQLHNRTVDQRTQQGWTVGEAYSAQKKTDPDLVPFGELPHEKKIRVSLMVAVIRELSPYWPL